MTVDEIKEITAKLMKFYSEEMIKCDSEIKIAESLKPAITFFGCLVFNVFIEMANKDQQSFIDLIDNLFIDMRGRLIEAGIDYFDKIKEATNAMDANYSSI